LVNLTPDEVVIRADTCVAVAEPIVTACDNCENVCLCTPDSRNDSDAMVRTVVSKEKAEFVPPKSRVIINKDEYIADDHKLIASMLESLPADFSDDQRSQAEALLLQFVDILAREPLDVGCTNLLKHKLELADSS
jgi:hypothetical protein